VVLELEVVAADVADVTEDEDIVAGDKVVMKPAAIGASSVSYSQVAMHFPSQAPSAWSQTGVMTE
jgi:hypothetical protein